MYYELVLKKVILLYCEGAIHCRDGLCATLKVNLNESSTVTLSKVHQNYFTINILSKIGYTRILTLTNNFVYHNICYTEISEI